MPEVQATNSERDNGFTSGNVRYVTGSLLDLSGSQRLLVCHTVKTHIAKETPAAFLISVGLPTKKPQLANTTCARAQTQHCAYTVALNV